MVTDPTILTAITPQDLLIGVDHNHHHIEEVIMPTVTNLMLLGVQVEMVLSTAIEVLEGVKVS